jgi:hypothetical protein
MYLCYFDESGISGIPHKKQKLAEWFILNCTMVIERDWMSVLNALVQLRKDLNSSYGIDPSAELKGRDFRTAEGAFSGLNIPRRTRMNIYEEILNWETTVPISTFSIAVHKEKAINKGWSDAMYCAWNFALNRLHVKCGTANEDERFSIFPDQGHAAKVIRWVRSMRRFNNVPSHFGPGSLKFEIERVVEDPSFRDSRKSYFVQIADLNAYASHRSQYVQPIKKFNSGLWDKLSTESGEARNLDVNKTVGGPPGIKLYP